MRPIERAYDAMKYALAPSRQLDVIVAKTLSPDMLWRGEKLKSRHLRMAFTRGLENADRFVSIALPRADWNVGSIRKDGDYFAMIWVDNGTETYSVGNTPALALLLAALRIGKVMGGFPIDGIDGVPYAE